MRTLPVIAFTLGWAVAGVTPATAADLSLRATLNGANVVSATESEATGEASAMLDDDGSVRIQLAFGGLQPGVTGAALHEGKSSENGPLVAELAIDTGKSSARLDDIRIALTAEAASRMRAGETYLVVSNADHPAGAIRGQLIPQPVRLADDAEAEEAEEADDTHDTDE